MKAQTHQLRVLEALQTNAKKNLPVRTLFLYLILSLKFLFSIYKQSFSDRKLWLKIDDLGEYEMRRNLQQWLTDYGATHQNQTNKRIHFVCVPAILFSILGILWSLPVPAFLAIIPFFNWALVFIVASLLFYAVLSIPMTIGMMIVSAICVWVFEIYLAYGATELWTFCLVLFVLAWIGQFIGHAVEGKKPSFFEDLQFLLIAPLWMLGFIYQKLSIPYGARV